MLHGRLQHSARLASHLHRGCICIACLRGLLLRLTGQAIAWALQVQAACREVVCAASCVARKEHCPGHALVACRHFLAAAVAAAVYVLAGV